MKQPDQSDRLEKLVNQLKEQLHVLGSESHEDSILKGLVDVQGLTEMTQGMLKDAERRLAGCRQHAPGPRNAPFLVPFTDASCSGSLIENDADVLGDVGRRFPHRMWFYPRKTGVAQAPPCLRGYFPPPGWPGPRPRNDNAQ